MIVCVIQARMGSTRLPGKVLELLAGVPVIDHVVSRVDRATTVERVVVATSIDPGNLPLIAHIAGAGTAVYVGAEDDVLDRYWQVARLADASHIVRITADCPAIDPEIIDQVVEKHLVEGNDYTSNVDPPTWPDGLDVEVMTIGALDRAWHEARHRIEREHVTAYIRDRKDLFSTGNVRSPIDLSGFRFTLDQAEDLELLSVVFDRLFRSSPFFGHKEILNLIESEPSIAQLNSGILRNSGA